MTKVYRYGLTLIAAGLLSTPTFAKAEKTYRGFNYSQVGIQSITYKEELGNFATVGDLSSEIEVTNTILQASSYTHLFDNWGFTLSTQGNLLNEITQDQWKVAGYGEVQTNDAYVSPSDLQSSGIYHLPNGYYVQFGGQLKKMTFTRSNIEAGVAADEVNAAIRESDKYFADSNPPQLGAFKGAIQEDLTYLNGIVGVGHHSLYQNPNESIYWYASATLSAPLYYIATNTQLLADYGVEEITGSFNGYEFTANAGMGFEMVKNVALSFGVSYGMSSYDKISTDFNDNGVTRTASIPNVDVSSYQVSLGITWIN